MTVKELPPHSWQTRAQARFGVVVVALAAALVALAVALSSPHLAAAAGLSAPYPRLADWWGSNPVAAEIARRDYYVVHSGTDAGAIASLRSLNPDLILLSEASASELSYSPVNDRAFDAQRIGAIPTSWLLTQVGSTLTSPITATSAQSISVADTSKFRVKDLVVIDDEKCVVTSIASGAVTVNRGFAGSTAATHASGTRIAAVASVWPGAATLDMTAQCPLGRATGAYATPGTGTERAADWLARRTAGLSAAYTAAGRNGVLIDACNGDYTHSFRPSASFRTVADRAAPTTEPDYAAFDRAWQSGIEAFLSKVRALVGDDVIIMTNYAPPVFATVNGTCYEGWPKNTTSTFNWHETMFGPTPVYHGAYLDWSASAKTPNLTTIMTYGQLTDYRLMRFGLTSTLMGDGYFSYEDNSTGHSANGRWYDEYDNAGTDRRYLGQPLGAAHSVTPQSTTDLLSGDGAFATSGQLGAWTLAASNGAAAAASLDGAAAKIVVSAKNGPGDVQFRHPITAVAGKTYRVTFRAKASAVQRLNPVVYDGTITTYSDQTASLTNEWQDFSLLVSATRTGTGNVYFYFGNFLGTMWFDDVVVREVVPEVWRRDFQGGVVLVNAEPTPQTVSLGGTFRKIRGTQAPTVNDGSLVTAVTLQSNDGIVLLREGSDPVPDTTPPTTTSDARSAYTGSATIRLSAIDSDSGVAATYYRLDGGTQAIGTRATVDVGGAHTLEFWSIDRSGNTEPHQTVVFSVTPATPRPIPPTSTDPVATAITIQASTARVYLPRTFVLTGVLTPGLLNDGCSVEVKRPGSGRWSYSSLRLAYSTTVAGGANWWYKYSPKARGTYYFRARFRATTDRLGSVSRQIAVVVR